MGRAGASILRTIGWRLLQSRGVAARGAAGKGMFLAPGDVEVPMGQEGPRLRPHLGLLGATAVALGAIIGAGIFVVLGEAARLAGALLPLAIVVAAATAALTGLSAAQLGVNDPRAGGAYEFGRRLLRPAVGFVAGWLYLLQAITAGAAYTLTFVTYLQPLLPGLPLRAAAVGLALAATAANLVGLRILRRTNELLVALKVAVLLLFVVAGLTAFQLSRLAAPSTIRPAGLLSASALFFFALAGYAQPVMIVEEIRDPARDLPRAVLTALAASAVLYLAIAIVALGLVGPAGVAQSPAPLVDALAPTGLARAQVVMAAGAAIATSSVLLAEMWALSRLAFAMARGGDLPAVLCRLSRGGIPTLAVLIPGAVIALLAATVDLSPVLAASSLSLLAFYAIQNLASLRLQPEQRLYPQWIPALGLAACLGLALSLSAQAFAVVGVVVAVGLAYYLWRRRGR